MFHRLFLDHPQSMGETYLEHQRVALSFAFSLLVASLACVVHALVPGLCASTGSRAVTDLNDRLVLNRRRHPALEDRVRTA
jgi:hypothetical protein